MLAATLLGASSFSLLAQDASLSPAPPTGPRPSMDHGHPPHHPPPPLMEALDTNHDGILSADEIANASASLKKLDKNGDGQLTEDELRPPPPSGGGPNGGPERGHRGPHDQSAIRPDQQRGEDGDRERPDIAEMNPRGPRPRPELENDGSAPRNLNTPPHVPTATQAQMQVPRLQDDPVAARLAQPATQAN